MAFTDKTNLACPLCAGEVQDLGNYPCLKSWSTAVMFCHRCGSLFRHPMPSQEQLKSYYDNVPFTPTKRRVARRLRKTYWQAAHLKALATRLGYSLEDKLIDIGAGIGGLVKSLKEAGFKNVEGIEGRKLAVDFCQKEFGIDLNVGWVFDAHKHHSEAKFICLSHVLEHLKEPGAVISYLKAYYPGSIVWIEVPNGSFAASQKDHDIVWSLWLEQHLWSFTPNGLRSLLEQHGLTILEIESGWNYPAYDHIRYQEFTLAHTMIDHARRLKVGSLKSISLVGKLVLKNFFAQLYKSSVQRLPYVALPDDPYYLRCVAQLPD